MMTQHESGSDNSETESEEEEEESEECVIVPQFHKNLFAIEFLNCLYVLYIVDVGPQFSLSLSIEDDFGEELLSWSDIFICHFELFHMVYRILLMIPEKIATGLKIAHENIPGESGSFLLKLAGDLLTNVQTEAQEKNYPSSFIESISLISDTYAEIITSFDNYATELPKIKIFLEQCQPLLEATKIFSDWGHSQLVFFHRNQQFSPDAYNKLRTLFLNTMKKNLLLEFDSQINNE